MDKVYEHSRDIHVRNTYVYAKALDPYAYLDKAKKEKVSAEMLADLFAKGVIVVDGDNHYHPVSFNVTTGVATLTYAKTDGTTATVAVLATLKSKEYVNQ